MSKITVLNDIEEVYQEVSKRKKEDCFSSMGYEIIKSIKKYGLGVLPKADLEGLIFHCICNAIELEEEFKDNVLDLDYTLMQMLRVSPSKLRSLRATRSARFLVNLDYKTPDNKLRIINALRNVSADNEDIINGKVKISISDPHVQKLIERMIESRKGIIDHSFNPKLLVLSAKEFMALIIELNDACARTYYEELLKEIKKDARSLHKELTKESVIEEFQNEFKKQAFEKLISISLCVVKNIMMGGLSMR